MSALLAKALSVAVLVHAPCPPPSPEPVCAVPPATIYFPAGASLSSFNHELGHIIDFSFLTNADRGRFAVYTQRRHRDPFQRSSYPRTWSDEPNSMSEQFAEAVRMCAHSQRYPTQYAGYGWLPTTDTHRRVCRWLTTLGRRAP